MVENNNLIEFDFPEDREKYLYKIIGYLILAFIILFAINKISIALTIFCLFVFFIVMYEKIYMFLTVDKVSFLENNLIIFYKKVIRYKVPLNNLGVKITNDINNTNEISFYDFQEKNKIFSFKENEVNQEKLSKLIKKFESIGVNNDIFKSGTYGEMILLYEKDKIIITPEKVNYMMKKQFFGTYRWMIILMVIILIILTLYFK